MSNKITSHQLDYIYSVLSEKLEDLISKGWYSHEDEIIELHLCMAQIVALEMDARKNEATDK